MAWLRGDQYDSLMNYPLTQAITDYFALDDSDKETFMNAVTRSYLVYPKNVNEAMFNLLESHDTTRLLSLCNSDKRKARLAYLFMFTQVGSPCIYYGGEVGMDGRKGMGLENNRKCMIWNENEQDLDLKSFIHKLIKLRKSHPDWNEPKIHWYHLDHPNVIAYARGDTDILINNSGQTVIVEFKGQKIQLSEYDFYISE